MTAQLARVDWQLGQTLLPEHFVAQEESLVAEIAVRFGLLGVPFVGVGRLRWNESLLADGVVSITTMTVVLPSGEVIDVPGNAAIDTFNLNVAGTTRVPVYVHVTGERAAAETASGRLPAQRTDLSEEEGGRLDKVVHRLVLSADQSARGARHTFKLAEFVKSVQGGWQLGEEFVPPLVQVGTSPFLLPAIDRLAKQLELFHFKLQEDIAVSFLGGESLFGASVCLEAVYRLERFLANVKSQVHFHPYHLHEALKTFYTQLCIYQNTTPENAASPYTHDDIGSCMRSVLEPLMERIQVSKGKVPYVQFAQGNGLFAIEELPKELHRAKEIYFLVQKPRVSDVISIEGLKLAARSRLNAVHQLSLQGIPYRRIERPPFQHQFGAEVEFYLISEGEEWDLALRDGTLAFFDQPSFSKIQAYLYWRHA